MTELAAGFVLGLAGSAHCAAMCGPLAIVFGGSTQSQRTRRRPVPTGAALYHAGRLTMYAGMGVAAGFAGAALRASGMGRALAIGAGLLMLLYAASFFGVFVRSAASPLGRAVGRLTARAWTATDAYPVIRPVLAGMLNAWLPCGMLYAAATAAGGLGGAVPAAGFMLAFGLGTLPGLAAATWGLTAIPTGLRARFRLAAPIAMVAIGALLILRGVQEPSAGRVATTLHQHHH